MSTPRNAKDADIRAASKVEPERGRPEMKCSRFCMAGQGTRERGRRDGRRPSCSLRETACQAGFAPRLRRTSIAPSALKPASIIAQVEGSGTAEAAAIDT